MKTIKRITALMLTATMLFALTACGENGKINQASAANTAQAAAPSNVPGTAATPDPGMAATPATGTDTAQPEPTQTAGPTEPPAEDYSEGMTCYSDACDFYFGLLTELADTCGPYIRRSNEAIEQRDPENYLDDPQYLDLVYMPFAPRNMAVTIGINDGTDPEEVREIFESYGFENVEFTSAAPGEYTITFTDVSEIESVRQQHEIMMRYDNGSVSFEARVDGETTEFEEFVSLGGGYFALQNMTDRAIVLYKDGQIVSVYHSVLRYETDGELGDPTSWSNVYEPELDSIWGRHDLNRSWVDEKNAQESIYMIFELSDGAFVVSGFRKLGYGEDAEFVPMDPIVMR